MLTRYTEYVVIQADHLSDLRLKCLYSNVDQLLNKMEDLKLLIASNEPYILMLTEVIPKRQANPIEESQKTLNGYVRHTNFEISDSNLGASGIRGTAIFVKEELKGRKVTMMNEFDDHVWIELQLKNNDKLLCGCIYRSPKKELQYIKDSTKKVCKVIQEATNMHPSHLLICGDFNYPEIDWIHESVFETTETIFNPSMTQYKAVTCFSTYLNQPDLEMEMNRDYWTLYLLMRKE